MKILSKNKIERIARATRLLFDTIIKNTEEDSIERDFAIKNLNEVRDLCNIPKLHFIHETPFRLLGRIPMPKVKPPKQEEHIHDFMILHTNEVNATICCRACGEVRHIETMIPMKKPSNKIIKISLEDLDDLCDGAASFRELKELLIERMENE